MEKQNKKSILAEKETKKIEANEEVDSLADNKIIETPIKRPKGRPKKPVNNEELEFKKRVAEETEKAYRDVIESKIKSNIKRELKNKALEDGEKCKDPEPKAERPQKIFSKKQMENLAKGR